jgi:hypothetical protein
MPWFTAILQMLNSEKTFFKPILLYLYVQLSGLILYFENLVSFDKHRAYRTSFLNDDNGKA